MGTIRSFIAVQLPDDVYSYLGQVSNDYESELPDGAVRWVKPKNMHLTIRFLGDTPVTRVEAIQNAMDSAVVNQPAFDLKLDRLGCFPSKSRPRVIWAGISGPTGGLQMFKSALDKALAPLGWLPDNKRFRAHLTLGRVKHSHEQVRLPWGAELDPLAIPVAEIQLLRSELFSSGPVYTVLHKSKLSPNQEPPGAGS